MTMRRLAAALAVVTLLAPLESAFAFDTFWHSACSGGVAGHLKFSADATNILQFGTFGPDFFGPAYDKVFEHVADAVKARGGQVRKVGVFMHFDNLAGDVDRNWKLDYLFQRLANNTANTIAAFYQDKKLNEGTRRILVLEALGCSLHMLQDFYSHTDWTHFDFPAIGFPQTKSEWGQDTAPTWFQMRVRFGSPPTSGPETWPIEPHSGIYPPPAKVPVGNFGVPMSHTNMNHDNSQLFYEGASRIADHDHGAHPAKADPAAHQLFAVSTAATAGVEWISVLEAENPVVRQALDDAKGWDLGKFNPAMLTDLTHGLELALAASCFKGKWDGDNPPPARAMQCRAMRGVSGATIALTHMPTAFNEFWVPYFTHNVLEKLTANIGDVSTGRYIFDKAWLERRRVAPANTTSTKLANGLSLDVPSGATAAGTATSTTVTSPDLGTLTIEEAAAQTADQAAHDAAAHGDPPLQPDPPTTPPPDWALGGGAAGKKTVRVQRLLGGKTFRCGGTGLTDPQARAQMLACRSLRS